MIGVSIFIFIGVGICGKWGSAQFLNHRPFPRYSLEDMPDTDFSCRDKILGGYYADSQTQCQMFHVCVKVAGVGVQDFRFLCPNSTAFDQEHQICADWEDVDCDAATLYYSSDNFDLYRIGSGFESKPAKYGEEEEPFALQRAETGDIRLNREHQTQRVNQQKEIANRARLNSPQPRPQTNQRNNNYNSNDNEKDIFKVSSSSNFFNNRNSGKETDEYDDDTNVNANQDDDRYQRRKLSRKQNNKPRFEEPQTKKPDTPTGFVNNFAGSSFSTTSRPVSSTYRNTEQYNGGSRQRQRGNYNYNNNIARTENRQNQEDDGQYREDNSGQYNHNRQSQFTVSTPAPFRRSQQKQNTQSNSNGDQYKTTTYSTEKSYSSFTEQQRQTFNNYNQYDNSQSRGSSSYPTRTEDTQITAKQNPSYATASFEKQTKETENYPTTPFKQVNNYPSTPFVNQAKESVQPKQQSYSPTPFQKAVKETEAPTTFRNTQQYTIAPFYRDNGSTEKYYSTADQSKQAKDSDNYSSQNRQRQQNKYENYPTQSPANDNTQQYLSNYEITKNKQSDYSSTQNFKKPTTFAKPGDINPTTFSPKSNPSKIPSFSESYSSTVGYRNSGNEQTNQQSNNYYNSKSINYNQQEYQNVNTQGSYSQQNAGGRQGNIQTTYNQPQQINRQSTQTTENKQTTQHTHYTPTVPRITTPYYSSTTSSPATKRSNRYDETQYDDGSYNPKYDNEDSDKNTDEVLKTAHSTNFASSRNEYAQNTKILQVSQTEKPRPFSVTPTPPKQTDNIPKTSSNTQNLSNRPQGPTNNTKKTKDASYDYAYYDSGNAGNDHEYDIAVDIEKSNSAKNKKTA